MSSVVLKVPDLTAGAKSALQVQQQQQQVSQQFQPQQQQAQIQSPYGAPQYPLKAIGDPQPATTNVKWGGYTEQAPWHMRAWWGQYLYVEFKWPTFLRSIGLEFVGSLLLAVVVPTVASVSTSPTVALNAVTIGLATFLTILTVHSWRHAHMSPRHCHQGVTLAETLHQKSAVFQSLCNLGVQLGAGFLSAPILSATGAVAGSLQNYDTAFRPVSYWGAFALDFVFGSLAVFAYQFNKPLTSSIPQSEIQAEKSTDTRAVHSTGSHFSLALFVGILVTQPNGMWTLGNWVPYLGPATNVGFGVPEAGSWTIPILWGFATGLVGWALQLLLWNVNGITPAEYEKRAVLRAAASETKELLETAETETQIRSQLESQTKVA